MTILRIATRASKLALVQSRWVADGLMRAHAGIRVELVEIRTTGDAKLRDPLTAIGGKGAFTKELEDALLDRRCDLAVHSLKDLPTNLPDGLALAATPTREETGDVMLTRDPAVRDPWRQLARGAVIGSSAPRRKAQVLARRADLQVVEFRGNVDTRLRKLAEGTADAIILACAGLKRLGLLPDGLARFGLLPLDAPDWLPAVGQGCLGIETRADDEHTRKVVSALHDPSTWIEITAERAFLRTLGAGCTAPVGALARCDGKRISLVGALFATDGSQSTRRQAEGAVGEAEDLGVKLAQGIGHGA